MAIRSVLSRSKKKKALTLVNNNQLAEAHRLYEKLCAANRMDAESWFMLGTVSSRLGRTSEAIEHVQRACELAPRHTGARYNLAVLLRDAGQPAESEAALRTVIAIDSGQRGAWSMLGQLLSRQQKTQEATEVYLQAIKIFPGDYRLCADLALTLSSTGNLSGAIHWYREAIGHSPDTSALYDQLAGALSAHGHHEEAEQNYAKSLQLDPSNRYAYSNWLLHQHYRTQRDQADLVKIHAHWPGNIATKDRRKNYSNNKETDRRLRIAYLSADFRTHSVAYFVRNLLAAHQHEKFEIWCYADVSVSDAVTCDMKLFADQWCDVAGMEVSEVASRIELDQIDILVDLGGHTSSRILSIAALQPAPVQATYLGYPDTTGLGAIDYRFTDAIADPPDSDSRCSENLVRISQCFLCYAAPEDAPDVAAAPVLGNGFVTFGSFNNFAKLNQRVVAVWSDLLKHVTRSRLYLKNPSLDDDDARARTYDLFKAQGIGNDRLVLRGRAPNTVAHLQQYAEVDIALDTFPYCGTTTTCEALWMGLPVVTLTDSHHAGRVGSSLLQAIGKPDWIAASADEYIELAAQLASNSDRLIKLRTQMRASVAASILCDGKRFTGLLENVYRDLWTAWASGDTGP